jgi:eukaryotic translation initiation factor 2C
MDVTVYDYFMNHWSIKLDKSADFPCLNVGKPKRPTYLPLEVSPSLVILKLKYLCFWSSFHVCNQLCLLVPLQRYKNTLSTLQRSKLVEGSRQKPHDRMSSLSGVSSNSLIPD